MVTLAVQALPDVLGLVHAVRVFDTFTPDNAPCSERVLGIVTRPAFPHKLL